MNKPNTERLDVLIRLKAQEHLEAKVTGGSGQWIPPFIRAILFESCAEKPLTTTPQ